MQYIRSVHGLEIEGRGSEYFEGCSTAQNPESPLGSGDGDIETPHICQKANAGLHAGLAGTHARHDDYIHLLALEAIHCLNDNLQGRAKGCSARAVLGRAFA